MMIVFQEVRGVIDRSHIIEDVKKPGHRPSSHPQVSEILGHESLKIHSILTEKTRSQRKGEFAKATLLASG